MDVAAAIARVEATRTEDERQWLAAVPLERALEAIDAMPEGLDYTATTPALEAVDATVSVRCAAGWTGRYWNLVLLHLVARTLERGWPMVLPADVHQALMEELERIVVECETGPPRADPLGDGDFLTDLAYARGRLLPFGVGLGVAPAWLPKEDGDDRPWILVHLSGRRAKDITDWNAWIESKALYARFLWANPNYGGLFGTGWMSDPQLGEMSPHLAIVRQMLVDGGATIVDTGHTDAETIEHATSTSATRRRHYKVGAWTPSEYRVVWPRENFLRSAEELGITE